MTATDSPAVTQSGVRAITAVWIILCALTIGTWWLAPGHSGGLAVRSIPITLAVIALGVIKGRLIIRYFMEVRSAPRWLKVATDAWLVILWLGILAIYLY